MYNAAFLTKCFDSIYYLQQGATRWRLKKHTEGSMMPCRFRRRLWKMWTNIREYLNYLYDLLPVYFFRCFRGKGSNGKDT